MLNNGNGGRLGVVRMSTRDGSSAEIDLTGDLATKRGRVSGSEALPNNRVAIIGEVPLAELDGYDARLKSITGGEGSYSIDFSHYAAVPASIQKQLMDAFERQD